MARVYAPAVTASWWKPFFPKVWVIPCQIQVALHVPVCWHVWLGITMEVCPTLAPWPQFLLGKGLVEVELFVNPKLLEQLFHAFASFVKVSWH